MVLHRGTLGEGPSPAVRTVTAARASTGVRGWALCSIPRPARVFLLATEILAVVGTLVLLTVESPTRAVSLRFLVLLGLSIGYAELAKRSERIKRYLGAGRPTPRPNPMSVWSFAALLVLPAGWAAGFIAAQYGHALFQRWRDHSGNPYRVIFTATAAILAQLAAATILDENTAGAVLHGQLAASLSVLGAGLLFTVVDIAVLLTGMWLTTHPPSIKVMLPDGDALGYELALLVLGIATAEIMLRTPAIVAALVIPVAYLHRSSMIKTLHQQSRTDSKTGLLDTAAWTEHARTVLARCTRTGRPAAVIIIDVDHFKAINDHRGHLVGDQVLIQVARALQRELRDHDALGRFGGDEFVIILEELAPADAEHTAQRLLTALSTLQIEDLAPSLSMGLAHTVQYGTDVTELLHAADAALYTAKASGRGRLCIAPALTH